MSNITITPTTPELAPTDQHMKDLAGSFISVKAANKAILLQPKLVLPTNEDGKLDEMIENMQGINNALATAQEHATEWNSHISMNVQNQLQMIVSQADFSRSLGEPLSESVNILKTMTSMDELKSMLNDIHDLAEALADNINDMLFGPQKTIRDYDDSITDYPTNTVYGTYKQLGDYQIEVTNDTVAFKNYITLLKSDDDGIDAEIETLNGNIVSYRKAITNDQTMIAGGSAAIATGVVLVVVAVALTPETAGGSMAIGAVGVAAILGGIAADSYGIIDLMSKEDKLIAAKRRIQELNADKAALVSINDASTSMVSHTETIYNRLEHIITNWQQMQNNITETMEAIRSMDDPNGKLQQWIDEQNSKTPGNNNPMVMYAILHARLVASGEAWNRASATAQALLKGIAGTVEKVLPPNTKITQDVIDNVAQSNAA